MKRAPPFPLQGSQTFLVTYLLTVVLETLIDNVKLKFFLPLCFVELLSVYLQLFDNISHTVCEKTAMHSLICLLRSLLLPLVRSSFRLLQQFDDIFGLNGQKTIKIDA